MISFRDIVILPFEGQILQQKDKAIQNPTASVAPVKTPTNAPVQAGSSSPAKLGTVTERKKFTQPGLKLVTNTIGIKSILDPPKNTQAENDEALLPDLAEPFSHPELMAVWTSYALNLKRERKDSLYATLTGSEPILTSDFQIKLEIANTAQAIDLEREKVSLLAFLRSQLKNYQITFSFYISEKKQVFSADSKSTFEKLAEENPSLHKFRKLFNLDIDF